MTFTGEIVILSRKCARGVAQLGLERLLWEQEVGGSNPLTPTLKIGMKVGSCVQLIER